MTNTITVLDASKAPVVSKSDLSGGVSFSPETSYKLDNKLTFIDYDAVVDQRIRMGSNDHIQDSDVVGSVFMARELEYRQAQALKVLYAENMYRQLFPVLNIENPGYISHSYSVVDQTGKAKFISTAANDMPRVEVTGKDVLAPIYSVGIAYGLTTQEIASAQLAGFQLVETKASACRAAVEQLYQDIALNGGGTAANLNGLLVDPNIAKANVVGGTWATKTPLEIYEDVVEITTAINANSLERHTATDLIMPTAQRHLLVKTRMADGTDTTLLNYILKNIAGLTISSMPQLKGAGTGGLDPMIAYEKNSENFEFVIGFEYSFIEPQWNALEMLVPGWGNTAGMSVKRPLALTIREGI